MTHLFLISIQNISHQTKQTKFRQESIFLRMPTDFCREPNFIVMTLLVFFSTCDTDNICPISNPPPSQHQCTRELQSPQLPQDSPEQQVLAFADRPWNGNGWSWIGNGLKTIYYDLDARHRVEAGAVIIMDVNKPHLDASEKDAVGLRKSKPA